MRSALQLDESYKVHRVKSNLERSWSPTPVKSACFVWRRARFAVLQVLFSGLAEVAVFLSNVGSEPELHFSALRYDSIILSVLKLAPRESQEGTESVS